MYPETTRGPRRPSRDGPERARRRSFYKAEVAAAGGARFVGGEEVCLVRFADDEDEAGVIPDRAVPARPSPARGPTRAPRAGAIPLRFIAAVPAAI